VSTTIPGRLIEERPKSIKWDPLVDTNPPFWVPKSQIENMTEQEVTVTDWWVQQAQTRGPTEKQLFHRAGRCWVCWHYYHQHPMTPAERWGQPPYRVMCDGTSYNLDKSMKVARGNFHRPEWKAHVEQVKTAMLALGRPDSHDILNDLHDAENHPDGPCGRCGETAPYTGVCPMCGAYNYQGFDLPHDDS
jgi:hypothetical protein